jgi:hypothetical protein
MAMVFNDQGALVEVPDVMASPWESMGTPKPGTTKVKKTSQGATTSASDHASELEKLQMLRILNQEQNLMGQENRLNNMYGAAAANQQTNIRPLLQLTDSWTGSRLASNYQDPETAAQLRERLGNAEDKIQRRREAITDDQMNLIKARLMSEQQKSNNALRERLLGARLQASAGGKTLPAHQTQQLGEANAAVKALDDVTSIATANKDIMGPVGTGAITSLQSYFQLGDRGKRGAQLESELRSRRQIIGKYLEGGVLRKEDEEKYEKMLPTLSDSPDVVATKIDNLKRLIANRQEAEKQAFSQAGYNVGAISGSTAPGIRAPGRSYEEMTDAELEALLQGN